MLITPKKDIKIRDKKVTDSRRERALTAVCYILTLKSGD
jgi:hypothetical protein